MINPRSLIRALDKHWDAIERIVLLGRDQMTYERDELLALLSKVYVHDLAEQQIERLQHLINAELLIEMSHSNTLQLNENVRQFAGSLLHEHELGLSDILKARIILKTKWVGVWKPFMLRQAQHEPLPRAPTAVFRFIRRITNANRYVAFLNPW